MLASTGSLIPIHSHDNKDILDLFTETEEQKLLYRGKMLDAAISEKKNNFLSREEDGLYVNGEIIKEFSYINGVLKFKGETVTQEYDKRAVTAMVYELWKEYDEKHSQEEEVE